MRRRVSWLRQVIDTHTCVCTENGYDKNSERERERSQNDVCWFSGAYPRMSLASDPSRHPFEWRYFKRYREKISTRKFPVNQIIFHWLIFSTLVCHFVEVLLHENKPTHTKIETLTNNLSIKTSAFNERLRGIWAKDAIQATSLLAQTVKMWKVTPRDECDLFKHQSCQ